MRSRCWLRGGLLAAIWLAGSAARAAEPVTAYVVQPGDTLDAIGRAFLVRPDDYRLVQRRNRIADPRRMPSGMRLDVPIRLLRVTPVALRLGAYRGAVTVDAGGRSLPPSQGMIIEEGAVVATGANAFARLDLPDGSHLALPSQSRIRVERLRRTLMTNAVERVFTVESGRGESTVTPLRNPQDRYIVRTPMSVSAVRGTEFRVVYDPEQRQAATEVVRGTVLVSANQGAEAPVAAGFGASATASEVRPPKALSPAPVLLQADRTLDEASVALDIAPMAEARAYRVRLAADAGFLDMLAETTSPTPRATFESLANGIYFVRISVIGPEGLEGLPATYAVERALNTLTPATPAESRQGRNLSYLFRWETEGEGARTYRFQLAREQDSVSVIDEVGLTRPQITVTNLKPGTYLWRVMSRTIISGRSVDKWSATQTFHIGD